MNSYNNFWLPVTELFRIDRPGAVSVAELMLDNSHSCKHLMLVGTRRPVVIDRFVKRNCYWTFWNDTIQALVIKTIIRWANIFS